MVVKRKTARQRLEGSSHEHPTDGGVGSAGLEIAQGFDSAGAMQIGPGGRTVQFQIRAAALGRGEIARYHRSKSRTSGGIAAIPSRAAGSEALSRRANPRAE